MPKRVLAARAYCTWIDCGRFRRIRSLRPVRFRRLVANTERHSLGHRPGRLVGHKALVVLANS